MQGLKSNKNRGRKLTNFSAKLVVKNKMSIVMRVSEYDDGRGGSSNTDTAEYAVASSMAVL